MTFSSKFSALDNREAALLDDMRADQKEAFTAITEAYAADFRPESDLEKDTVYCIATLRWGIDRIRAATKEIREVFAHHGYVPPKFRSALDELDNYERELQIRYEYYFSQVSRIRALRPVEEA